jgi:hypothetical protein
LSGLHSGLLQLLEGLSGIDALMLAGISDEQHFILQANLAEEIRICCVDASEDSSTI